MDPMSAANDNLAQHGFTPAVMTRSNLKFKIAFIAAGVTAAAVSTLLLHKREMKTSNDSE